MLVDIFSHLLVAIMTLAAARTVDGPPCWPYSPGLTLGHLADLPSPAAAVAFFHARAARIWARKSHGDQPGACGPGRPRTRPEIENLVLMIKNHNRRYGGEKIAAMLAVQFGFEIHPDTVRNILRRHPSPGPSSTTPRSYWTFLRNHTDCMASMDFKVVLDWLGRQVFILNILHHDRRRLLHVRATRHPTEAWIAQQLREAFPFYDVPRYLLLDHDPLFRHAFTADLPRMGIRPVRTAKQAPWQNPYVERFNLTLASDLLDHLVVFTERRLNHRLREYRTFYNTARPHGANGGEPPIPPPEPANEDAPNAAMRLEVVTWCGGLHRSYRCLAA